MKGSRSALRWVTAVTAAALCVLPVPAIAASQTFVPDAWYQSGSTGSTVNTPPTPTQTPPPAPTPTPQPAPAPAPTPTQTPQPVSAPAPAPIPTSTFVGDGWYRGYASSSTGSTSTWGPAGTGSTAGTTSTSANTGATGGTAGTASANPPSSTGSAANGGSYGVGTGSPANMPADAAQIISWTNTTRAQHGMPPLAESALLDHIALLKCQDMVNNNYFSHDSPTYGMPLQMQQAFGVQARIMGAENLAGARDTALAYTMLVNSPGHLANILYNGLTDVGVAVVPLSVYGVYVCQEFTGN